MDTYIDTEYLLFQRDDNYMHQADYSAGESGPECINLKSCSGIFHSSHIFIYDTTVIGTSLP